MYGVISLCSRHRVLPIFFSRSTLSILHCTHAHTHEHPHSRTPSTPKCETRNSLYWKRHSEHGGGGVCIQVWVCELYSLRSSLRFFFSRCSGSNAAQLHTNRQYVGGAWRIRLTKSNNNHHRAQVKRPDIIRCTCKVLFGRCHSVLLLARDTIHRHSTTVQAFRWSMNVVIKQTGHTAKIESVNWICPGSHLMRRF